MRGFDLGHLHNKKAAKLIVALRSWLPGRHFKGTANLMWERGGSKSEEKPACVLIYRYFFLLTSLERRTRIVLGYARGIYEAFY